MKYLIDKIVSMSKQSVSAAAIVNSKGEQCGKILVRFTNSTYGWNHEVSAILYEHETLNMKQITKGESESTPRALYALLKNNNIRCFTHNKEIGDYSNKLPCCYDSLSSFSDIARIKYRRKSYQLMWVV